MEDVGGDGKWGVGFRGGLFGESGCNDERLVREVGDEYFVSIRLF